jgi:predicted ATP-binding protein involved in virulence
MEIVDRELIRVFNQIEERLLEIQNILSTPSVVQELDKYTDIDTIVFLEIIEIYLYNLDSLKKINNKNLLKKLSEKLNDFIFYSESELYIKTSKLKLDKAFIFIKNQKNLLISSLSEIENKFNFSTRKNSNFNNIFIDSMKVYDFKQFNSFEIDFSKQINIIIGQNAIGKTTLLQATALGLLQENSPDKDNRYGQYISKNKFESTIEIAHNETTKKVKILRTRRDVYHKDFTPFLLAYGSNFFTDYRESNAIVKRMLDETIIEDFAHTIFLEHTDKFWNVLSILRNLTISNYKEKEAKEKKGVILKTINNFLELEGYKLVEDTTNKQFYFQKNGDKVQLSLEDLSEGYRGNVLLITDMLIKILGVGWTPETIEGIVLIDEFDKHLHPRWQSRLVKQLTDTFPHIQFIMTTHNPMSILDRDAEEVTILKEVDGEIKAIKKRVGTKKIGVSTVLLEYFGVESTIGKTMKDKIDEYTKLKLKDTLTEDEKKQQEELEEFLDETVATNFIYNRAYFNFLKFLKNKNIDFEKYEEISSEEMEELLEEYKDLFE